MYFRNPIPAKLHALWWGIGFSLLALTCLPTQAASVCSSSFFILALCYFGIFAGKSYRDYQKAAEASQRGLALQAPTDAELAPAMSSPGSTGLFVPEKLKSTR